MNQTTTYSVPDMSCGHICASYRRRQAAKRRPLAPLTVPPEPA